MTAVILGWWVLDQQLSPIQILGIAIVLGSVWLSQRAQQLPSGRKSAPADPAIASER